MPKQKWQGIIFMPFTTFSTMQLMKHIHETKHLITQKHILSSVLFTTLFSYILDHLSMWYDIWQSLWLPEKENRDELWNWQNLYAHVSFCPQPDAECYGKLSILEGTIGK